MSNQEYINQLNIKIGEMQGTAHTIKGDVERIMRVYGEMMPQRAVQALTEVVADLEKMEVMGRDVRVK